MRLPMRRTTAAALLEFSSGNATPSIDHEALHVAAPIAEHAKLIDIVRALDAADIDAIDINRRLATLDDVFLSLTTPAHPGDHVATIETEEARS